MGLADSIGKKNIMDMTEDDEEDLDISGSDFTGEDDEKFDLDVNNVSRYQSEVEEPSLNLDALIKATEDAKRAKAQKPPKVDLGDEPLIKSEKRLNDISDSLDDEEYVYEDDTDESDDGSEAADLDKCKAAVSNVGGWCKANKSKLIIFGILMIVLFIATKIKAPLFPVEDEPEKEKSSQYQQQPQVQVKEKIVDKIVTQTIWDTTSYIMYDEYVEIPDKFYSDEIIISKFILKDESTCLYYFSGIPKQFKRKVIFPVTLTEYNKVASGSKIFIDYRIRNIEGKDYILDVQTSVKE